MRRKAPGNDGAVGQDSFLDVVTNVVGILILLTVAAGIRARSAPAKSPEDQAATAASEALRHDLATEQNLRGDLSKQVAGISQLDGEIARRSRERDALVTMVAEFEHRIADARRQLDADAQATFDLRNSLADARGRLETVRREEAAARPAEPSTNVVESLPTPLSTTVEGDEIHFQLRGGRVAYIPMARLLERFKGDVKQKLYRLLELPELTDTVGPDGGFRLRYTMQRQDVSAETQLTTGRGAYARLKQWTLIPSSNDLGEPLANALADGSQFRHALGEGKPGETAVTLWVYPDSFEAFRTLKKELWRLGYMTSGRPLPEGVSIGGSPDGTKSAAE